MRTFNFLAAAAIVIATPAFATEADWVGHNGNAQNTRSLNITTKPENYHLAWDILYQPYPDAEDTLEGNPVIAEGKSINTIMTYKGKQITNHIVALDAKTGATLWKMDTPIIQLISTYFNSKFYMQGRLDKNNDNLYALYAYDAQSGAALYAVDLPDRIHDIQPYHDAGYFSVNGNTLGKCNLNNGAILWTKPLMQGMKFSSRLSINKNYLVARSFDNISVFNRADGELVHKIQVPDTFKHPLFSNAPVINNDDAFAVFIDKNQRNARLYAFNLRDGKIKWQLPNQRPYDDLVLINKTIFSVAQDGKSINAVNTETGKIEWTWAIPDAGDDSYPSLIATADVLFVDSNEHLYAVSQTTHEVVWQYDQHVYDLALGDNKLFFTHFNKNNDSDRKHYQSAIALN